MAKLQFNGTQYSITIPAYFVERMGWKKGEMLVLSTNQEKNAMIVYKND